MSTACEAKNGFYLGAGVGAAFTQYKFDSFGTASGILSSVHRDKNTGLGNVFAGYGATFCNNFYIGGEIGTDFPNRKITFTRTSATTSRPVIDRLTIQDYITMDVLPGFRVIPCVLIYGRLGTSVSELTVNQSGSAQFNYQMKQLAGRLGAGVNYRLNKHFSTAADYIYTDYRDMTGYFQGFTSEYKNEDRTNYVGLSLIYTFA